MERRTVLKSLLFNGVGAALFSSCFSKSAGPSIALDNPEITHPAENLLPEIVETFIPATDTPGAKDLNICQYVLMMVDECLEKPDREIFVKGLDQFDPFTKRCFGKSFLEATSTEREQILRNIQQNFPNEAGPGHQQVKAFLSVTKRLTIQGYVSSQYFMTEIVPYQLDYVLQEHRCSQKKTWAGA